MTIYIYLLFQFGEFNVMRMMLCDPEMLSPRGQNFGFKALASASNIWPRPGLGSQQKNQQPRLDWPICLPITGHHTMIHVERSYW